MSHDPNALVDAAKDTVEACRRRREVCVSAEHRAFLAWRVAQGKSSEAAIAVLDAETRLEDVLAKVKAYT